MANVDVIELTTNNFDGEILQSSVPALVDFWAVWCGPCQAIAPTVEAMAAEYRGRLRVGKLNVDDHPQIAQRYQIRSIPTLLVFEGGEVVGQLIGAVPKAKIEEAIKKVL